METVFQYKLALDDIQSVWLPEGAEILTVQTQYGIPCLWALVDDNAPLSEICIETFGAGHPVPVGMGISRKYIGTYQLEGGAFIFHVFERF